jgi:hypothetical protein
LCGIEYESNNLWIQYFGIAVREFQCSSNDVYTDNNNKYYARAISVTVTHSRIFIIYWLSHSLTAGRYFSNVLMENGNPRNLQGEFAQKDVLYIARGVGGEDAYLQLFDVSCGRRNKQYVIEDKFHRFSITQPNPNTKSRQLCAAMQGLLPIDKKLKMGLVG